jgi:hypothetical protein
MCRLAGVQLYCAVLPVACLTVVLPFEVNDIVIQIVI